MNATAKPTVLISGAGIAGSTLAYWLARNGFRPTVVERARDLRSSGAPVDVRGTAIGITERMGVMPMLREAATATRELVFLNAKGRRTGRVNMKAVQDALGGGEVEIHRGKLASILFEAARDDAEFLFHDSITGLEQDAGGVDVSFEQGPARRFDLVIGADGLHSNTRRLAFGPESAYVRHAGVYFAAVPFDGAAEDPHAVVMFNAPGRTVAVHPAGGLGGVAFIFHHEAIDGFDPRDTEANRRVLHDVYGRDGWRVPEFLTVVDETTDLFFDSVSRVVIDHWAEGRVALLGDAASSVSLFGDGSSSAISGAYTLAEALAANPRDHAAAYARYEEAHRKVVGPRQAGVNTAANLLIPRTAAGIATRNAATRLWPLAAAGGRVKRLFQPSKARVAAEA